MRTLTLKQRGAGAFSVLLMGLVAAIPGWEIYTAVYRGYVYIRYGFYATYAASRPTFYFGLTFNIVLLSVFVVSIAILLFGIVTGRLPNSLMASPKPDADSAADATLASADRSKGV
jgi:uncharacterized membrane protein